MDIDTSVLAELKERARKEGKTLGCLMSELLARAMTPSAAAAERPRLVIPSKPRYAKIDIEDKEALWALFDSEHDIRT